MNLNPLAEIFPLFELLKFKPLKVGDVNKVEK